MRKARILTGAAVVMGLSLGLITASLAGAHQSTGAGVVTAVSGPVSMIRALAEPKALKFRDQLQWQDVVETKKDGSARILLAGKTSVTVRELSRLELKEEGLAAGKKYTVSVVSGKVRATVERTLLGKGEEVEINSPNAVVAVRGTDLVVEVKDPPTHARGFGMLASLNGGPILAQALTGGRWTFVYTLTGQVEVFNPTSVVRRVERIGALEGVRIQGAQDPVRFAFTRPDIANVLRGLNPPAPPAATRPATSDNVKNKAEQLAATETTRTGNRPGVETPIGGGPRLSGSNNGDEKSDARAETSGKGGDQPGSGSPAASGGRSLSSGVSSRIDPLTITPKVTITKEVRSTVGREKGGGGGTSASSGSSAAGGGNGASSTVSSGGGGTSASSGSSAAGGGKGGGGEKSKGEKSKKEKD